MQDRDRLRAANAAAPPRDLRVERQMKTPRERELEAELATLGWDVEKSERTPGGWKVSIRRGPEWRLEFGTTAEEVLESLVGTAKAAQ